MADARLELSPFAAWAEEALSGDASGRRYARLTGPAGESAILMDAAAEPLASLQAFLRIGGWLRTAGFAAPEVLWLDEGARVAVLGDLGRLHFSQWLDGWPKDETTLYAAAVDVLPMIQNVAPPDGLVALVPVRAAGMIGPLFDFYAPAGAAQRAEVTGTLQEALTAHAPVADVLALRDYHAENLIWRPHATGVARVGLLDFQDAVLAPAEYDLASLLGDARRDVSPEVRQAMISRFAVATGRPEDEVRAAVAVLGVQRNLRILGIFARLAKVAGKTRYLPLLPRVYGHVAEDLSHPALTRLRGIVARSVPAPDDAFLRGLMPR